MADSDSTPAVICPMEWTSCHPTFTLSIPVRGRSGE
jgi:hypothetical protein